MPIDPAGTTPGLTPKKEEPAKVNMRCRNANCDSIVAIEVKLEGQEGGHRMYQCCKCKQTRGVAVGGSVTL